MAATTAFSLGVMSILAVPRGAVLWAAPAMIWAGATSAAFGFLISAMLADLGDEFRLEQGKERLSLLYALNRAGAENRHRLLHRPDLPAPRAPRLQRGGGAR